MKILISLLFLFCISRVQDDSMHGRGKTVMAVFAHSDDNIVVDRLLSHYARSGYDVYLVLATKGEKGVNTFAAIPAGDSLSHVRAREAICACKALGIHAPILLGMSDGTLAQDFTGAPLHKKIDSVFRIYKPDIVITWGPEGGYGHMDHRLVHDVVTEIYQSGDLPGSCRLYYDALPAEDKEKMNVFKSPSLMAMRVNWKFVQKKYLPVRVKTGKEDAENAVQAMECQASQFSAEERDELKSWIEASPDTIYLRPFVTYGKGPLD
ncbi:MAG TPA: PIG-L family deacetylase [Puia sp.]|nr:PIG-L family deacetylase [Puia sp.]